MSGKTGIEWTDATWNPIRGCSRVSEGCRNCYAEKVAYRFSGPGQPYEGLVQIGADGERRANWNGQIRFVEEHLLDPLKWKKPQRIFVNSMSDLFHENVTNEMLDRIFAVMALCPQHTFQVLTKRPERMLAYLERACGRIADLVMKMRKERNDRGCVGPLPHIAPGAIWWPLANVWLGVSVENQKAADERIPLLLQTPAAERFISAEPLLGPVDLAAIRYQDEDVECEWNALTAFHQVLHSRSMDAVATAEDGVTKLGWVICGGESGHGARPMHPDWARGLRDQCVAAGVPFFFKQWGEWEPSFDFATQFAGIAATTPVTHLAADGHRGQSLAEMAGHPRQGLMVRTGKKRAGRLLGGREWNEFPEAARG